MSSKAYDVIVIGGGAIGLASAFQLAGEKQSVLVLDAGEPGREASWAGGGILSPIHPYAYPAPLIDLVERSTELYPRVADELAELTGISIELRRTGLLRVSVDPADDEPLAHATRFRKEHSLAAESVTSPRAFGRVLPSEVRGGLYEPETSQIRNPRLLKALLTGCTRRGVEIAAFEPVTDLLTQGDRVIGVKTTLRTLASRETVLAAGAWSGELARRSLGLELGVEPVRGQMLLVEGLSGALDTMVLGSGGRYLIPRADGRILVGSTLEHVGFDRRPTLEGVQTLLTAALRLAPGLAGGHLARAWAGLRPATPDRLPYLGRAAGLPGVIFATGHYRNGLVLTPITAKLVEDLALGRSPAVDLRPFEPGRRNANPAAD